MGSLNAAWQEDAACRTEDPDLFFPEHAGARHPTSDWRYAAAKAVCARCPMTAECLGFALSRNERFGVWGNTVPADRERMRRERERGAVA